MYRVGERGGASASAPTELAPSSFCDTRRRAEVRRTKKSGQNGSSESSDSLGVPAGDLGVGAVRSAGEVGYAHLAGGVLVREEGYQHDATTKKSEAILTPVGEMPQ